jgi:hypothetical protein
MADTGYALVPATPVNTGSGPFNIQAGTLLTDSGLVTAYKAAGGTLGSAFDPNIVAAAALVQKMRARGADENVLARIMLGAASGSADATVLTASQFALDGAGPFILTPSPSQGGGVVQSATFEADTTPAAGESAVLQLKLNGTNVGTALTYDSTKAADTVYNFTIPAGTLSSPGDLWTLANTYTAGGGPALGGKKGTVVVKIAP